MRQRVYFPLSAALLALIVISVGPFADAASSASKTIAKAAAKASTKRRASVSTRTTPSTTPVVSVLATIAIPGDATTRVSLLQPDPTFAVVAVATAPGSTAPGSTVPGSSGPGPTAPGSTAPGSTAPLVTAAAVTLPVISLTGPTPGARDAPPPFQPLPTSATAPPSSVASSTAPSVFGGPTPVTVTTVTAPTAAAGPGNRSAAAETGNRSAAAETVGRSAAAQTVAPDVGPVTESTGSTSPPTIATTTTLPMKRVVEIVGHGFGHGRGLGQWGAFGYATDYGWTAKQILSHFYPGTGAGKVAPTSAIGVRLLAQEGKTLTVYQPKGRLFVGADGALLQLAGGTPPPPPVAVTTAALVSTSGPSAAAALPVPAGFTDANPSRSSVALAAAPEPAVPAEPAPDGPAAIRITLTAKGTFTVADSPDCDGPFVVRAARVTATAVVVSTAADRNPTPSNDPSELLSLCGRSGRAVYRGDLLAIDGAASGQPGQHTVNQVGLESYLRSVVPSEVPKGWGGVKGGMEALKAQAVAARSYAAAERRTGYSNTCDTTSCQVYKGRGEYRGSGFVSFEDARTDQAVADTAGEVRVEPKTGTPIRTEFSSSTGGHSAPGEIATPVLDEGDSTANNPYKSWTVVLDASRFEGKLGPLTAVETTKRDGFGPDGGRAQEVTFRFVNGTSTNTGAELASRFGLRSTLFSAQLKLVPLTTSESKLADPSDTSADDSASGEPTTSLPKTKVIKPSKDPAARKGTTTIEVKRPTTNS